MHVRTKVSSLTAIYTTALLNSPTLPLLLQINAKRLASAYETIVAFFVRHNISYIPVSHGPFVFARIAGSDVTSWEQEAEAMQCFKQAGVVLSAGHSYHIVEHEKGWARITFAIPPQQLNEALKRLERGLLIWQKINCAADSSNLNTPTYQESAGIAAKISVA